MKLPSLRRFLIYMANPTERPGFLIAWLDDLREDLARYGARALVPWKIFVCCIIGYVVARLVPEAEFWAKPEISVVFFTAALTINGLLLALSWGSFAKIYELASEPAMAAFLRKHNLLRSYIFHVDYIHFTQVCAVSWSSAALVLCVIDHIPHVAESIVSLLTLQEVSLAGCVASSIYALTCALGAVRIMQDLVWYSAYNLPQDGPERGMQVHEGGKGRD
jgi:hypothetical protein